MHHHPDLVAAVQVEALRCYGLVLGVDDAARALRFVQDPGPHVVARRLGPEHEAANAALRWWRVEHELDRPGAPVAGRATR
jgi:hypothetical protein